MKGLEVTTPVREGKTRYFHSVNGAKAQEWVPPENKQEGGE